MIDRLLRFAIAQRGLVLLATVGLALLGIVDFRRLPIDAVPDITNVQVQINTAVQALSPLEVEQQITFPIETAMAGLPRRRGHALALALRPLAGHRRSSRTAPTSTSRASSSTSGCRRRRTACPTGIGEPDMGPIATGLGEIFFWTVEADTAARSTTARPTR